MLMLIRMGEILSGLIFIIIYFYSVGLKINQLNYHVCYGVYCGRTSYICSNLTLHKVEFISVQTEINLL